MTAITSIMRTFLNTERRRENKPEPLENDEVEASEVDEQVVYTCSLMCLLGDREVSLVGEGRSLLVVGGVDEECS